MHGFYELNVLSCFCIIDGEKIKRILFESAIVLDRKTFVHERDMKRNAIIS